MGDTIEARLARVRTSGAAVFRRGPTDLADGSGVVWAVERAEAFLWNQEHLAFTTPKQLGTALEFDGLLRGHETDVVHVTKAGGAPA